MSTVETASATEGAIWSRVLEPASTAMSMAAARSILALEFPVADKKRMHDLAAKARAGSLTPVEQEEICNYERIGNLLALLKSKARQRLKKAARSNGSGR